MTLYFVVIAQIYMVSPGVVPRGVHWGRPPVKYVAPCAPPQKKKVQDKAFPCQDFQKACSAVVILMLSCFVTF